MQRRNMIEHVTFPFVFWWPNVFCDAHWVFSLSLFHCSMSRRRLNRIIAGTNANVPKTRSKALVRFSEAAAQLTNHLWWKEVPKKKKIKSQHLSCENTSENTE